MPVIALTFLAVLLGLAPYAMTFTPFAGIYASGTYAAPYETDPLQARRVALVLLGLCATVASLLECGLFLFRRADLASVLGSAASLFACAVVGWHSFPYWVTGVYAAYSGRVPWADFDPKGLIPAAWLGEWWTMSVLILYPAAIPALSGGMLSSILLLRRGYWLRAIVPAACAGIGLLFLTAFSPGYVGWILD